MIEEREISKAFVSQGLTWGRMISGSKSGYLRNNPNNKVVFNANIFTEEKGKIWWGDLDLTLELDTLKKVAAELKTRLIVLREFDGRFGNEDRPFSEALEIAVEIIDP
jgi:hypothetical protein